MAAPGAPIAITAARGVRALSPGRENWDIQSKRLHMIGLYDFTNGGVKNYTDVDPITEFAFPAGLESVDSSEPPAKTITFLQGNGVHVEHGGIRQKPIAVSGTTGLRPNRIDGTKIPILNVTLPSFLQSTQDDTGLPRGERTGFDDLVSLVNFFRFYESEMQRSVERRLNLKMVWTDGRLGESWIVEPIGGGCHVMQTSRSPMTYSFDFQLLGLKQTSVHIKELTDDFGKKRGGFAGFLDRVASFTAKINESFNFVNAIISRVGIVAGATVNTILGPVRAVIDGLRGVIGTTTRFLQIPRNIVLDAAGAVAALINDARAFGRQITTDPFFTNGIVTDLARLFHHGRALEANLNRLAIEDHLFAPQAGVVLASRRQRYAALDVVSNGNPADMRNLRPSNGAAEGIISGEDTIESMARRVLGDASRWIELVLMNNLRAPYISRGGNGRDVLRPGDRFLYPSDTAGTGNNVARAQGQQNSGTVQAQLGTDIRLEGTFDAADWAVENGDFGMIAGGANFAQAIQMRVSTQVGSLPVHPSYGVPFAVGKKVAELTSLTKWRCDVEGSLLQDPRTASVNRLFVALQGNTVRMNGSLTSITGDSSLALNFAVQR